MTATETVETIRPRILDIDDAIHRLEVFHRVALVQRRTRERKFVADKMAAFRPKKVTS